MKLLLRLIFFIYIHSDLNASESIEGIWKHATKPAWIEIKFKAGEGSASIKQHQNNTQAEGLNIMSKITPGVNSDEFLAKMYSAEESGYVSVKIVRLNSTVLVVYEGSKVESRKEILRLIRE